MIKKATALLLLLLFPLQVFAADRYIDSAATGANTGGIDNDAWQTWPDISWGTGPGQLGPGDTLWISGGEVSKTYHITAPIQFSSGVAGSPITVKIRQEAGHNGIAIIDGGDICNAILYFPNRHYVTVDGRVNGTGKHIRIQNWGSGILPKAINGTTAGTELKLYGLHVVNDDLTCAEADCSDIELKYGVYFSGAYTGCVFADSIIDGAIRKSLVFGGGTTWDDNLIENVTIKGYYNQNKLGGPDGIVPGAGTTIRYCLVYHEELANAEYNPSHTAEDGIQINSGNDYIKGYGNVVFNISQGPLRFDPPAGNPSSHVWFWSNLFFTNHVQAGQRAIEYDGATLLAADQIEDVKFLNNTIVGFPLGSRFHFGASNHTDVAFKNNINVSSTLQIVNTTGDTSLLDVDYNLFLDNSFGYLSGALHDAQVHNPYDAGKTFAFVFFTPLSVSNDYRLPASATMALGAGVDLGATYGVDLLRETRVTPWDLGAYKAGAAPPSKYLKIGNGFRAAGKMWVFE